MSKPIKIVKPQNIPLHELNAIINGKKEGMTQKEIKQGIDSYRKMSGTYKGKGISTNTISRVLGKKHSEQAKTSTKKAWERYTKQHRQKRVFEEFRERIKSEKEQKKFDKFAKRIIERGNDGQLNLDVYIAEDDTFYVESP